jgi:DNA-binding protein HU-beta
VALMQAQLVTALADRAELSKRDAKRALDALDEVVLDELGNAQKVRIGQLVQLTVRVKPAQKARKGRNPATGEEITVAAKPARVDVRARAAGAGEGGAAIGAEGTSSAGRLRSSTSLQHSWRS